MDLTIKLLPRWVNARMLDSLLQTIGDPHGNTTFGVTFYFPEDCKIMVDAGVRLLSLANQLANCMKRVRLDFAEGMTGTMGYLDRLGFFEFLDQKVEVLPERPLISSALIYGGQNPKVLEYIALRQNKKDPDLPGKLSKLVGAACSRREDRAPLEQAAFTVFAELIENVYEHSESPIDGYAALQVYENGGKARVVVSDSGKGIIDTLRPALDSEKLRGLSDIDLIVEIFRQGLSKKGKGGGCGLKASAAQAIKFRSDLDVRVRNCSVYLKPSGNGYLPNTAHCRTDLPLIWGTHIYFDFQLDKNA